MINKLDEGENDFHVRQTVALSQPASRTALMLESRAKITASIVCRQPLKVATLKSHAHHLERCVKHDDEIRQQ